MPPVSHGGWLPSMLAALRSQAPDLEVTCACRSWPAPEPFESDGVRYITLPRPPAGGRFRSVLDAWSMREDEALLEAQMRQLIADSRPDVIHQHGTEQPHALSLLRVAGDIPVLVSIQGPTSEIRKHWMDGLTLADKVRDRATKQYLKGGGLAGDYRVSRAHGARELEALDLMTDAAGRTAWDRDIVTRANPLIRYWHIDEVLRPEFYTASWRGPAQGVPTLLAVTRAASIKGIDVLLRAYARVLERRECRLNIVGQVMDTPLWPSLRRLEARLGLGGRVDWVGERAAAEIITMLSACSAAVTPARIDNSPNSVCEAMLVGAPVVATATGGIPSLIDHGVDGLLFPLEDDSGMAEQILRVLGDDELAARLGAAARKRALVRHDPARVGAKMLKVYSTLARGT